MDSQWLKTQFDLNPAKTKAGLAAAIHLEPSAVSKILKGTRQIKAQEYILMRQYFGLPNDGHASLHKKPDSGEAQEMLSDNAPLSPEWMIPTSLLSSGVQGNNEKTRILQVRENLMEPEFCMGDHVLVDITDRKPIPPGVFMVSDGFNNMLRYCEFVGKSNPADIKISAKNGKFQAQILKLEDFLIVGRVIAKLQMI